MVLYLGRHYDRAIAEARKALELEPNDASTHEYLGLTYLQKGTPEEALAELQKALSLERAESGVAGYLAGAYAVSGNREEALKILGQLKQQSKREYVSPYSIASAYVRLGDRDRALAWLQKGFDVYDGDMDNLKVDAALDPLRSDPRFHDLLRRMNFPP